MSSDSIVKKIKEIKKNKNAVILAHNYQIGEVQDIADFVGDSLELSRKAAATTADLIIFCGVFFMAETAKILSPKKKVVLPDKNAGCPMADMITGEDVKKLRKENPDAIFVAYVNSSAEIKSLIDICCTSGNAIKVVNSLPIDKKIIFLPDKYLGDFVNKKTGRHMELWNGYCPTHLKITPKDIEILKNKIPDACVLVHPECTPEAILKADEALSTAGIYQYVSKSSKQNFIIGTELGMLYKLKKDFPEKMFYPVSDKIICPNMKKITLEKTLWALEEENFEIVLSDDIIKKAQAAVQKMLAIG